MFIEIEGIEGAGKSTQCLLLQEWMIKSGLDSIVVKELGSTSFSREVPMKIEIPQRLHVERLILKKIINSWHPRKVRIFRKRMMI